MIRSDSSPLAVSRMIGMRSWSCSRSRRITSRPPIFGSIRSSTTRSGRRSPAACKRLRAVCRDRRPIAGPLQVPADDLSDRRLVVDHQHGSTRIGLHRKILPGRSVWRARGHVKAHMRSGASANSAIPSANSSAATNPSSSRASRGRGEHVPDVTEPELAGHDRRERPVEGRRQRAGHLEDAARPAAGDVERAGDRGRRRERQHVGAGDVAHVDEVAKLAAVLEHARRARPRSSALRKIDATPAYGVSRGIRGP